MGRSEYQGCMTTGLRSLPKGVSKEERKLGFCIMAKTCSGKAANKEEARRICLQPKPPKAAKAPKSRASAPSRQYYDPNGGPPGIPDGFEICN